MAGEGPGQPAVAERVFAAAAHLQHHLFDHLVPDVNNAICAAIGTAYLEHEHEETASAQSVKEHDSPADSAGTGEVAGNASATHLLFGDVALGQIKIVKLNKNGDTSGDGLVKEAYAWCTHVALVCGPRTDQKVEADCAPQKSSLLITKAGCAFDMTDAMLKGLKRAHWTNLGLDFLEARCIEVGAGQVVYRQQQEASRPQACLPPHAPWLQALIIGHYVCRLQPPSQDSATNNQDGTEPSARFAAQALNSNQQLPPGTQQQHLPVTVDISTPCSAWEMPAVLRRAVGPGMKPGHETSQVQKALNGALSAFKAYCSGLPGCQMLLASKFEMRMAAALPALAGAMQRIISSAHNRSMQQYACQTLSCNAQQLAQALQTRLWRTAAAAQQLALQVPRRKRKQQDSDGANPTTLFNNADKALDDMGDAARMEECMDEDGSMGQDADACMEGQVQAAAETAHHSLSGPYPSIVASAAGTADGDEQLWELLGFRLPLAAPTYAPYTNDTSQTPGASAAAGTSTASAAGPPGVLAPASARPSTSLGRVGLASGQGMAVAGSQQAVAAHHITPAGSDSTSLGSDMHMQGSSAAGQPGTAAAAVPGCRATVRASAASVMAGVSAAATAAGCMQGMYAGHVGAHAPRMQRPSGRQRSAGQAPVPQSATGRAALLHARAAAGAAPAAALRGTAALLAQFKPVSVRVDRQGEGGAALKCRDVSGEDDWLF